MTSEYGGGAKPGGPLGSCICLSENCGVHRNTHELEFTDHLGLWGADVLGDQSPSCASPALVYQACITACRIRPRAREEGARLKSEGSESGCSSQLWVTLLMPQFLFVTGVFTERGLGRPATTGSRGPQSWRQQRYGGSDGLRQSLTLQKQLRQDRWTLRPYEKIRAPV